MKRLHFTLAFAVLTAGASYGTSITYDTAATIFGCTNVAGSLAGCGTSTVTIGSLSDAVVLSYLAANSTVNANPSTNANFGVLSVSCVGPCSSESLVGISLNISIEQLLAVETPVGSITGNFAGSVSGSGSGAFITFGPNPTATLAQPNRTTTYGLPPNSFLSLPTAPGSTTIQGTISDVANAPEPTLSLLMAGGLLAIGTVRRRRVSK